MFGYIYLTTNLINDMKYIGKHQAETFDEKYLGSGKYLKRAISKYGKHNFKCSMLKSCDTLDELNISEIEYINKYDAVNSDRFYNLARGGEGHTAKFSASSLEKLRISHLGYIPTDEARKNMSEAQKRRKQEGRSANGYKHKKPMTEEHKQKIVNSRRKNNTYAVSEETRRKMSEAHKNQIPWNKGLKREVVTSV